MRYLLLSFLFCSTLTAQLDISGYNLSEFRSGKVPELDTKTFESWYNRNVISFTNGKYSFGLSSEVYTSPFSGRNYVGIPQIKFNYYSNALKIDLGNFYPTLGRGLLLRSFFIPGAVIEDFNNRSPTYFHRDFLGGQIRYKNNKFSIGILGGSPLDNFFPPTFPISKRRSGKIASIDITYDLGKLRLESISYSLFDSDEFDFYQDFNISYPISNVISLYTEGAVDSGLEKTAFYTGMNLSVGNFGGSIEYKMYNSFLIGNGFNEPPALVKQHTYRTLNRSTHVPNPENEEGFQLEMFYNFPNGNQLNFNRALAYNDFGIAYTFQEYFLEYSMDFENDVTVKYFIDYAEDPFKGESRRITGGIYSEFPLNNKLSIIQEFEYQNFMRFDDSIYNIVGGIGLQIGRIFNAYILFEQTNDPLLLFDDNRRNWLGLSTKYQFTRNNNAILFFGSRRGGPACTSGVCYEILDFKGVELRINSRF